MSPIQNVVVAGGSGNLGSRIVDELVKAGFTVTVLTRESSNATFPASVAIKKVDYTSVDSLQPALAGQHAVVSVLGTTAVGGQQPLIDAALAAGVKRFIPSEFGVNTRKASKEPIGKILAGKIKTVDYLIEKAKENPGFTWTGMSIGYFFDASLAKGWSPYNFKTKTATIYDSGNEPSQQTNLYYVGMAIAAVLRHLDETANKYIEVASFSPSQNEVLKIIEEETGEKWTIKNVDCKELQKTGEEKLAKGDFSAFPMLASVWQYADGIGNAPLPGVRANEMLGLPEDDLRGTIKKAIAAQAAA